MELRPLDPDELPIVGTVPDPRIALAIAYVHEHFRDTPSLAQIARHVHMSQYHFHRLFSRLAGISPKHYLQKKQIQVGKWLLRATKRPVGDIAALAGFASHGHFTSTCQRHLGMNPTQYRRRF